MNDDGTTERDDDEAPDEKRCSGCGQYPGPRGCACDDNYDGPEDDPDAWSGGFADNH